MKNATFHCWIIRFQQQIFISRVAYFALGFQIYGLRQQSTPYKAHLSGLWRFAYIKMACVADVFQGSIVSLFSEPLTFGTNKIDKNHSLHFCTIICHGRHEMIIKR